MEIKTKFNINDEVWFIYDNKVIKRKIVRINIEIESEQRTIYRLNPCINNVLLEEKNLFPTKEELLKSL